MKEEEITLLDIADKYCMDLDDLLVEYKIGIHIETKKINHFMDTWKAIRIVLENLNSNPKYYDDKNIK